MGTGRKWEMLGKDLGESWSWELRGDPTHVRDRPGKEA